MSEHRTLVDVLSSHAEQRPSELAYRFLAKGEVAGAATLYTFERLAQRAYAIGAWLQQRVGVGQRALLLYPPGPDFVEAFLGCLTAGVIAVPAFPPRSERTLPRLQSIVANAEPALVLSTAAIADTTRGMASGAGALATLPWQVTSAIDDALAQQFEPVRVDQGSIAFLQYTSGSTSSPKGVMVSHGNLIANQRAIVAAMRHTERDLQHWTSDLFVSWLPLQHDMGLIGPVLQGLYLGRATTLMSPLHFLQKPMRWLQAISHYRAHTSGAPNFAYDLCVAKAEANPAVLDGLDLSHWKTAFNGAEPVRWATMERFANTFAPCGFRPEAFVPCYGMAETTLLVTGRRAQALSSVFHADPTALMGGHAEHNAQGRPLVSCGVTEELVKVVDPERRIECAEGAVGEIWIAGPSVAQGYWRNPEATADSFGVKLRDAGPEAPAFLRSGDLGFLQGQELFVTGRLKDVLIVDGSNHYPHDLELTAERAHPAVRQSGVAAFALETPAGERPAIVAEVKLGRDTDPEQVIAAIRGAISDAHGVSVCSVALVKPQVVPKTSSGKVQRGVCRGLFERAELELIARRDFEQLVAAPIEQEVRSVVPPVSIESSVPEQPAASPLSAAESELARAFLLADVARRARVAPGTVNVDRPLSELGLGSRELVELTGELGELIDRELSPALFYDCPTIAHVLRRLEGLDAPSPVPAQASASTSQEPIAIVSMACRFPGDIDTPEALWRALEQGQDLVTRFPEGRWDTDSLYDPDPDAKGKCYTRQGGLLSEIDRFDAAFFDVPDREASSMDPQQRLLLEVAWEAIERAGIVPSSLNESVTGVYVGMFDSGYLGGPSMEQLDGYFGTGAIGSAASGRIAYTLGLQGPAVTVDTACSASLVAVHLAAQALRAGECDLALAGGVTLMVTPRLFVEFSRVRGLSPSGRCKSFADDADGANWGEGCGMLLLKRLSDAVRDGDQVLATLRGSAVNQDGRSQGLTAPNGPAQERVIKRALDASQLAPGDIDYVEAHGTGTSLGDPIEAGALARVFGADRTSGPLWLGSLKSNIAHTQAAAGVGGLIKVVLSLQHEQLPRTLHVAKPTRHVDWKASGLALVTEAQPWRAGSRLRRAGVSAFGVSGTNAHVVVEEAPARQRESGHGDAYGHGHGHAYGGVAAAVPPLGAAGAGLYLLSARSEVALRAQAARLGQYLRARADVALPDVALTLATRRSHFPIRAAVVVKERQALLDALASLSAGDVADAVVRAVDQSAARGKVAFVFPGQGSQWPDMGKLLIERSAAFAQSVARCDAALAPHLGWSVSEFLRGKQEPDALERIEVVQPALFTMMVSLAALWKALGVTPQAVVGHSQGELAAACVAGALSIEDAATVVARRSQILTRVVGLGGSAAVEMPVEELSALLEKGWGDRLAVAAWNGARSAVVSGEQQALSELLTKLEREQVFVRRLRMTVASHSAQMDPLEQEVKVQLAGVRGRASALPMYSTVLAQRIVGDELSTDYWYRNLREPVRFVQTLQQLFADGYRTFLEISPHPLLSLAVESAAEAAEHSVMAFGSLRRNEDADRSLKLAAAKLHVAGHTLSLEQLVAPGAQPHDALPTYAFDRQRYWTEPERAAAHSGMDASQHPLLGAGIASPQGDRHVFVSKLGRGTLPWLAQYKVFDEVVLSGASVLELCRAAMVRARPEQHWEITQLEVKQPLVLPERGALQVQVEVMLTEAHAKLALHSRVFDEASWTLHATASGAPTSTFDEPLAPSWPDQAEELWGPEADDALAASGVQYGETLRCVRSAARLGPDSWLVRASLLQDTELERYGLHPALLEAALQAATVLGGASEDLLLPVSLERWSLLGTGQRELLLQVERTHNLPEGVRLDVTLWDALGGYVGRASGLWLRPVSRDSLRLSASPRPLTRVAAPSTSERAGIERTLSRLPGAVRRERLLALLREEAAQVLGSSTKTGLPSDQPLSQLGLDSLKAVDLRNRVSARLGQRLGATLLFDHPTLDKLADYLLRHVLKLDAAPAAVASAAVSGDMEPIAIVSMACRLPGGVDSPESLWAALEEGRDLVEDFPSERWDVDALYDPDPEAVGKSYAQQAGFIHGLDQFDAAFFEISPREARAMDPQQRLLLETSWEALERAGIVPGSLNESLTGVYIGTFDSGYHEGLGLEQMDGYCATGAFPSVASGRLSYTLGLQGPALTIDTACSSSLVAVDLACRSLRSGQCDLALAGGVSLLLTPHGFVEFSRLRGLSPTGRCHAFSEQADGASWAEGCGIVVLKRLSDAQRDGDRVLALLRGSAVNQDGKSQGLTAPNGPSQERVIRSAIAASGLRPQDIDYVEAHGTGTTLGDPIEAGALAAVFGAERSGQLLQLGSLKSNLAHTQAAAGVSGLIKVVLSLQNELLPKSLYADKPSPHVDWAESGLSLVSEAQPWKRGARVRRAGVSAFGISGTNAHLVVEEAPRLPLTAAEHTLPPLGAWPLVVSARDPRGLREQAEKLATWLEAHPEADLGSVAYTAALQRSHFEQRAAVLASDHAQTVSALRALANDQRHAAVVRGEQRRGGKLVFVFPGQGSQWAGMGRALLAQSPTFARAVQACDRALLPLTGWSVLALLRGDSAAELPPLDRVDAVQPALFALSIGLVAVLRALGIEPDAVVGHSQGEVTAAVVSGALSLEDGAKVVALRSQAVREKSGQGGMLLIERPIAEVEAFIAPFGSRLSIAAVNTASSTVVSGELAAITALASQLDQQTLFSRRVNVDYASHSAQMDSLLPALAAALSDLQPRAGTIPLYSTVRCEPLSGEQLDAAYFCDNLRAPVRFDRALDQLLADGHGVFMEVSAHPVLALSLAELRDRASAIVVGTLQRERGELSQLMASLCELHVQGYALPWRALLPAAAQALPLPTYAFQRQRYWLEMSHSRSGSVQASSDHPLLGAAVASARGDRWLFTSHLGRSSHKWLLDHALFDEVLLSGTTLLELCRAAVASVTPGTPHAISQLALQVPVMLPERGQLRLQVEVVRAAAGFEVALYTQHDAEEWTLHATALAEREDSVEIPVAPRWPSASDEHWHPETYARLERLGLHYGPAFRGMRAAVRLGPDAVLARVSLPEALRDDAARYGLHPALLDAAQQSALALTELGDAVMAASVERWSLAHRGAHSLLVLTEQTARSEQGARLTLTLWDEHGAFVGRLSGLDVRRVTPASLRRTSKLERNVYEVIWQPVARAARQAQLGPWALVSESASDVLGAQLTAAGIELVQLTPDEALPEGVEKVLRVWPQGSRPELAEALCVQALGELQAAVAASAGPREWVWLTNGAVASAPEEAVPCLSQSGLWGLARSARAEYPNLGLRQIDVGDVAPDLELLLSALSTTDEPELALRGPQLRGPRLLRADHAQRFVLPDAASFALSSQTRGSLDALELSETKPLPLENGQVRIAVHSAGMNFRDVIYALDVQASELASKAVLHTALGSECSGVVVEVAADVTTVRVGQRVLAIAQGSLASEVVADARLVVELPAQLSFEEAATIPVAFTTAYYGLRELAAIKRGEKLLVHAAAGGVGMAALQLARAWGLEVYATASPAKWRVLSELGIPEDRIASSRDLSFASKFDAVDVVLNSLAREYVDASLGLLRPGGRFLELGKTDVRSQASVTAAHGGVGYWAYDLLEVGPSRVGAMLREVVALVASGKLTPLRRLPFPLQDARAAFRLMAHGGHVGKIVLNVPRTQHSVPQSGTILVTGGLSGLGLASARRLAERGAKHLLLLSRRGGADPNAQAAIASLSALGAEVKVAACDIGDRAALAAQIAAIAQDAPLTGIVHSAAVLDDGLLVDQTPERVTRVMAPKVRGGYYLHELTQHLPIELFVMYSSAAGVAGSPGQTNYAAANVFLDQLCHERRARGLPAASLAWGGWSEVGLAVKHVDLARNDARGYVTMTPAHGLALLELALTRSTAPHQVLWMLQPALLQKTFGVDVPAMWRGIVQPKHVDTRQRGELTDTLARLPAAARHERVVALLCDDAASVLGLRSAGDVPSSQPLRQLGLDSLMALELRNRIGARFQCRLSPSLLFDHPTLDALGRYLLEHVLELDVAIPVIVAAPSAGSDDPIAIISMACRYPAGIDTPADLWSVLAEGRDVVEDIPVDRWDISALFDADPDAPGKTYAREGGFVRNVDQFDPAFFEIAPREARAMDPQQRLLLETAWEALERAGVVPSSLNESLTGVYVGMFESGYFEGTTLAEMDGYSATGSTGSVASGRLAYTLGLQGPAMTVDTACSSSLVAIHLASQALRAGECDMALAGGITLMLTPRGFVEFSRVRLVSPTGRCKSFSDDADGAGWSDGCGMLLLKRLSDAQRDGDRVLGVIRSTAVNQDGRSQGLTAPNGPAQERVMRRALALSGLSAADVDYVEAHGTGTALGDPIEAHALAHVYGRERPPGQPLWLGSLKSNLAHSQAASGVGGVMKVVLSLQNEQLPATLHAQVPTRHVDWDQSGIALVNKLKPWPRGERARRAGVSAFGISGTNAHVIIEEAPQLPAAAPAAAEPIFHDAPWLIPVSARSQASLLLQAARLADHVEQREHLLDVGYTLAQRRSHFERRAALVTRDPRELASQLRALASGVAHVPERGRTRGKLAFVFPGHGPQWLAMGKALSERCPVFATEIERCDAALAPHTGFSVLAVLRGEPGAPELERVDVVQPALFAMTVALAALWRALGVEPDAVVGHSFGEIAAAHVAGALSLEDAAQVVALRARALAPLSDLGAMAVVELPAAKLAERLRGTKIEIGAYNSPSTCAVSGDARAIETLLVELEQEAVFARRVRIRFASHSTHVEAARERILQQLDKLHGHAGQLPLYSTVEGKPIAGEALDADYFYRNLREPVQFAPALERMLDDGYRYFVELSPHPMLLISIEEVAQGAGLSAVTAGSMRREQDPVDNMYAALAQLYAAGRDLAWEKLLPAGGALDDDLPTYAFDRQSYTREPSQTPRTRSAHGPLVQLHMESSERPGHHVFETDLDLSDPGYRYLEGHRIVGAVWLPGSALLEMALEAGRVVYGTQGAALEQVSFERAVELAEQGVTRLQLLVQPALDASGRRSFRVVSRAAGEPDWITNAQGFMSAAAPTQAEPVALAQVRALCTQPMQGAEFYSLLAAAGFERGATFQGIAEAQRGELIALAKLTPLSAAEHLVHPALLDAALQGITLPTRFPSERAYVPAGVASLQLYAAQRPAWAVCKIREIAGDSVTADITLLDAEERVVLEVRGFREVAEARLPKLVHAVQWRAMPLPTLAGAPPKAAETTRPWFVLADRGGIAESLTESLGGSRSVCIRPNRVAGPLRVDPTSVADFVRVLREAFGAEPPRAIVHAWSLDARAIDSAESLKESERLCCTSTLCLVQAIEAVGWTQRPRLFILTRGAQHSVTHPEQALAWGFGISLAQEHPELSPTLIDLDDPKQQREALQQLLLQSSQLGREGRIALRGSERLVPRLVRQALPQTAVSIRSDRSYLVSGGLGGLGLVIAERLIALGARHLVLLGRRGERHEDREKLARLRSTGAQVRAVAADVTDRASLARALSSVTPAFAGVVHAAGVIEDGTALNLSPARVGTVLAPKTLGTALIAELLPDVELFVLFSSISAVLGSAGQTVYAAANAFLDAWAQQRTAAGKPTLSLAWGPWAEVGMASDEALRHKNMAASMIDPITPEEGAELFQLSLSSQRSQLVLAGLDRERLAAVAAELPLLHELCGQPREQVGAALIVQQLSQTPDAAGRRALLQQYVAKTVARIADSHGTPSADSALKELGLDSLMLLNLRNLISRELHVELSTGKLLSLPTIAELAEHLLETLASGEGTHSDPAAEQVFGPVTQAERWPATRDVMRLLRSEQQGTPNAAHNIGTAARLHTPHSAERIESILQGIVLRHAALRTAIVPDAEHGHAMLAVPALTGSLLRRSQLQLRLADLPDAGVGLINERLRALLEPAFAWAEAPLWRFELIEDSASVQVLLLGAHHAVSDARSIMMVLGELDVELGGRALDRTASNRDMVSLLRAQPLSAAEAASDDAPVEWSKEFAGAKRLELTLASPRPTEPSYRLGGVSLPAPAGLFERLGTEASRLGVTPAAYFMGVLTALIARVSGQSRFAVGVPVDTRGHTDAEDALGFFGVPVPLPAAAHLDDAISDIIRRTDQQFGRVLQRGAAFANALPALVAEGLHQKGAPLIELFFNYINPKLSAFERLSLLDVGAGYGDVDLMVVVAPALQQVRLEYQVDILDADSCRLLGQAYLDVLDRLSRNTGATTVAQLRLSPALERVARAAKPLALPLAATFALGELPEFLDATFREAGLPVTVAEAPYHQVLASLLDPGGVFAQPGGLAGIVLLRGVDLVRYKDDWSDKSLRELADEYVAALSRLSQRADALPLLVGFLPDASEDARFRSWEQQLAERLRSVPGVLVLRSQDWTEHYPVEERFALEADVLGHLPFSAQFLAAIALTTTRKVWGMRQRPLKVVAVDGDNTLWSGIAGEVGPDAVDLSGPRAVLARKLLELRSAGVLLVLVSNNDDATVRQVLARPDSTLRAEHFSVISAEWDDKHARLTRAADKLSLGLDSFVFLDDNPVEIAAVRARLPQVMAITVPATDELESFVSNLWALDARAVTLEDHKRAGYYDDEQSRKSLRDEVDDFATFVQRLDLQLELAKLTPETLERSVQLTRRTNQFNLRPSHPAARALHTLSARPDTEVWTLTVRDRFGDYGQVGVTALEKSGATLEVLGFMLSCRVLGRGVEERIVHWLGERGQQLSCSEIKLVAEHSERNIPARRLVAALGGGHVESQRLEAVLTPERARAFRSFSPAPETTQRTGVVDVHGY